VSDSQSGTAIGANHFITAKHIAGGVGTLFSYQGANYTIAERFDSPTSDLTIFRVEETFGSFAPLYQGGDELGKNLVVIGRGAPRAGEVTLDGAGKGWYWGAYDGVQSWGENQVSSIEDGGDSIGDLLRFSFDADGGPNESHLAVGDSGGAVFIQEDGVWKLAGINYAVDGYYSFTGGDDPGFLGAIYDARGLYVGGPGDYEYVPATEPDPVPGGSYADAHLVEQGVDPFDRSRRLRGRPGARHGSADPERPGHRGGGDGDARHQASFPPVAGTLF
jgi:hypothetical protein